MASDSNQKGSDDRRRLIAVDRAAHELRRGRPVLVEDSAGTVIAAAAELATDSLVTEMKALGAEPPELALTQNRADTLKIRLYTDDVVLVPIDDWDDAETARSLADPQSDLANPLRGPFRARRDPVPRAVIAAVQLAKIGRLLPAALVAPAGRIAERADLLRVSADDALAYELDTAARLSRITAARVPLAGAEDTRIIAFRSPDGGREHLAIVIGDPAADEPVLARIHSECFTGDLVGSLKCDCGEQLRGAIAQIAADGAGILLYLRQEGRGIGLINKLRAYALQDQGFDTVEANERLGFESDERIFLPAAEILRQLGFDRVRLMTNNPDKVAGLEQHGIAVIERVPHAFPSNDHNEFYLSVKKAKSGHLL